MAHTDRFERISEIVRLEKAAREKRDFNESFALATRFQTEYLSAMYALDAAEDPEAAEATVAELHARVMELLGGDDDDLRRLLGAY